VKPSIHAAKNTLTLQFIMYRCDAGELYRVQFYLGEHVLSLDGCEQGLCDWNYIKDKFGSISDTCNLDFC